jgi:hypothetical protein
METHSHSVEVRVIEVSINTIASGSAEEVKSDLQDRKVDLKDGEVDLKDRKDDPEHDSDQTAQPTPTPTPPENGNETTEIRIESIETVVEDTKCSLRAIGEDARVNNNPVTLHRFAVKQMMMNNPHIKFYHIKWCSLVDYLLDWHWYFTRKCWKFLFTTTRRRFILLLSIVFIALVPFLNIVFLLLQSFFMLIYLVSFVLYVRNVWCCCNAEDPWDTMVQCDALDKINYLNFYVAVDMTQSKVDSSFISFETVCAKATLYRERFQEVSATFPLMLYTKDFVFLYKWIMLVGFGVVAGLFSLSVFGVIFMTNLIGKGM